MWHYIYVLFFKKIRIMMFFKEIEETSKYCKFGCGTMWHYVTLCGTMWHYIYVLFFAKK